MISKFNTPPTLKTNSSALTVLPPIQTDEFLPPISRWTTLGGIVVVGIITVAATLTSVIPYKVTVKADAIVRPAGELRLVQAAAAGPIMYIAAKENQQIKKGNVIATIDGSQLQTKKSQLQINLQQARLQRVQVAAQIFSLDRQVGAETIRINRTIASATAALKGRRQEYQDQKVTTMADVKEAAANARSVKAAFGAAQSKRDRYQPLADSGALSKNQIEEAQLGTVQQEQALAAAQAKLHRAQAILNPTNAAVAVAFEQIAQERASGQAHLATLAKEREALIQRQIENDEQLKRDTHELQQIQLDLNRTTITATANGVISKLSLRNSGQTVNAGQEIAQIVPAGTPLEVKAAVSPQDHNKLKAGQTVQMRVSACPYPDYGTLKGVVSQISEDTIKPKASEAANNTISANPKSEGATPFYDVTIKPERQTLNQGNNQCSIQAGIEGKVDIVSKEETVLRFLLRKARLTADV
jgi:HlyD family type I secretion membrane fusion protein